MAKTKEMDPHELYITERIAEVIGATWTQHDDNSQRSMYDVKLTRADGTEAALEVSRAADNTAFWLEAYCSKPQPAPGEHDWNVIVPAGLGLTPKILAEFVPVLTKKCEAAEVQTPDALPEVRNWYPGDGGPNWAAWYVAARSNGLVMQRYVRALERPQIRFALSTGGDIDRGLRTLDEWICTQVTEPWFASNVEKLERSGFDELHLGVSLHEVAVPDDLLLSFMRATGVDSSSNLDAGPLTDLWLFVQGAPVFVRWTKGDGWALFDRT